MYQILFTIPGINLPVFGFGMMLLVAFLACTWLGTRRAKQEGINPEIVWDLGIWVFIGGIIGARVLSLIVDPVKGDFWEVVKQFFQIWKGGLIFYGSVAGAAIAYAIFHWRVVRKQNISMARIADFAAPCIAIGIFFGRLGCFLNGCCWGDFADPAAVPAWQAVEFPGNSSPHVKMVTEGYQFMYGFTVDNSIKDKNTTKGVSVYLVDPASGAARAGLKPGDTIVALGENRVNGDFYAELANWPSGEPLRLTVESADGKERQLTFSLPRSLPLHPTQLYSSFDGLLAFFVLAAYYPFRRRPGEIISIYMMLYAVNRFLLEKLRSDNPPAEFDGLTMSQNISVVVFLAGAALVIWLRTRPPEPVPEPIKADAKPA